MTAGGTFGYQRHSPAFTLTVKGRRFCSPEMWKSISIHVSPDRYQELRQVKLSPVCRGLLVRPLKGAGAPDTSSADSVLTLFVSLRVPLPSSSSTPPDESRPAIGRQFRLFSILPAAFFFVRISTMSSLACRLQNIATLLPAAPNDPFMLHPSWLHLLL